MKVSTTTIEKMENGREFDIKEIMSFLTTHHRVFIWSWGARKWTNIKNRCLAFTVSGMLFKGNVFITLNGSDLFDIEFCSNRGNLKNTINNVYIEDLVHTIDTAIETK